MIQKRAYLFKNVTIISAYHWYMASTIDREMYDYFNQLNEAEMKPEVELLKTFMKGRKRQFDLVTIEQYNKEIDAVMERVSRSEYTTIEELEKEMQSW